MEFLRGYHNNFAKTKFCASFQIWLNLKGWVIFLCEAEKDFHAEQVDDL